MPSRKKIAPLLGVMSLGAAAALITAAFLGRGAEVRHTAAHPAATTPAHPTGPPRSTGSPQSATSTHLADSSHPTTPGPGCKATVTLVESWPGGYRGAATISNTTGRPMRGWYIQWILPQGTTLTQAWNGTRMQSGPVAMIHAPAEKSSLPAGATVSDIGFVGAAATPPTFTEITCG